MTKKLILILLSLWWGWTVLIDFAVIPTTFKVVKDFFNAGELGIALFEKLNSFELILSSLLLVLTFIEFRKRPGEKINLILVVAAWSVVSIYVFYLTPKISELTKLWQMADQGNQVGIKGIKDIQQEHQFFHQLYVGFDTFKLLVLSALLAKDLFKKDLSEKA